MQQVEESTAAFYGEESNDNNSKWGTAGRKGFCDAMVEFTSRVYAANMGTDTNNITLPPAFLIPFGYALVPSLIASIEIICRPSLPAIEFSNGLEQALTAHYASNRWESFKEIIRGNEKQKDAKHMRILLSSLYHAEAITSSPTPSVDTLLIIMRKMLYRCSLSREQATDDLGGRAMDPILSTDLFTVFALTVLLQRTKGDDSLNVGHLVHLLLIGNVLQSLVTILASVATENTEFRREQGSRKSKVSTTALDRALALVIAAMKDEIRASATRGTSTSRLSLPGSAMDGVQLETEVKRLCLPFLYRVALFLHFCVAPLCSIGTCPLRIPKRLLSHTMLSIRRGTCPQ